MARTKAKANGTANEPDSKRAAVREAMKALGMGAKPLAIKGHLKDHFGLDMNTNLISNYKTHIRKEEGLPSVRGRQRKARSSDGVLTGRGVGRPRGEVRLEDLRTIKDLASRLGPRHLRELVDLVAD